MAKWTTFPHAGDAEPWPQEPLVLDAWVLFHNGEFQKAAEAGTKAGGAGITVANKAMAIYANYLEAKEKTKLDLFMQVAEQAEAQQVAEPGNAEQALLRGAHHTLHLLAPYLEPGQRAHLLGLAGAYENDF